jgi:hypothetical protein
MLENIITYLQNTQIHLLWLIAERCKMEQGLMVWAITFLTCIWEVSISNLSVEIGYTEDFHCFDEYL